MTRPWLLNKEQCSVLRVHALQKFFLTREILFAIIPMLLKASRLLTYKMAKAIANSSC